MEDGLVHTSYSQFKTQGTVLILVVMEDGLVLKEVFAQVNEELES